jgi:thiamine-phosphate pyrophosphorylase
MSNPFPFRLYLVISGAACLGRDMVKVAEQAVAGGVDLVQLREKDVPDITFMTNAVRLKDMLDKHGIPLIINDNLQIAQNTEASGIHVGNSDISPAEIRKSWENCGILGYSIEYEEQLQRVDAQLADYLGISPVFRTPTKTDTVTEWGLQGVRRLRELTSKPLVAIGNINRHNAGAVIAAGADCLAVVSAICSAGDPARAAEKIRNEIEKTGTA